MKKAHQMIQAAIIILIPKISYQISGNDRPDGINITDLFQTGMTYPVQIIVKMAADHFCIAALQHAARRTDLCGGARVLPLPAAQPQPGLLGRGGKAAAGLERTAGFIEINLVIKINRRGSTLGK